MPNTFYFVMEEYQHTILVVSIIGNTEIRFYLKSINEFISKCTVFYQQMQ